MKRVKYILFILLIVGFYGCQKWIFKKDKATSSPTANFEYLWNDLNDKYSYFKLKKIDWDSIHTVYSSKISEGMSEAALFDTLKQMIYVLKDDHSNLISAFDVAKYNIFAHHDKNYDWHFIEQLYPNLHYTGPFIHTMIPQKNIAYVRYGSFESGFSTSQLDYVLDKYKDTKGMILDLRGNGGGVVLNVFSILSRFTSSKVLIGYSHTKVGPGKDDFGTNEPFYVTSSSNVHYTHPLVVLIGRGSYSATTLFAAATKAIPSITLVGDTTGGGGGLPGGGQLPNGWTYRFSISQFLYPDMDPSTELGVPPDDEVKFDATNSTSDEVIDKAVNVLGG